MISSASIDVKLSASPYHEKRKQENGGFDYLHGKSTYSAGYIHSKEPDYTAEHQLLLGQPGHVRRPDHADARLPARLGPDLPRHQDPRRRDRERPDLPPARRSPRLFALAQPDPDAQRDPQASTTSCSPTRATSPTPTARSATCPRARARASRSPTRSTRTPAPATPPRSQLKYYLPWHAAVTGHYRFFRDTWGIVAATRSSSTTRSRRHSTGSSTARCATTSRTRRLLQRPVPARRLPELHGARPRAGRLHSLHGRRGRVLSSSTSRAHRG